MFDCRAAWSKKTDATYSDGGTALSTAGRGAARWLVAHRCARRTRPRPPRHQHRLEDLLEDLAGERARLHSLFGGALLERAAHVIGQSQREISIGNTHFPIVDRVLK